jgi:hypothetical protein
MKSVCLLFSCLSCLLSAFEVDFVSSFNIEELPNGLLPIRQAFTVNRICPTDYFIERSPYNPDLIKIIVFDPFLNRDVIPKLPKEKLVLFVWEPEKYPPSLYESYSRVYTWDDTLIDNIKFFRFNYPYLMPFQESTLSFDEKKLCAMIAGNWTKQRLHIVSFFESYHPHKLDCYGRYPPGLTDICMWQGAIAGSHSSNEKITTLQNYRFCFCFENTIGLQGYITEKIFSCFAAGCIPIYWGADNIEKYIPKTCFIDYRDFKSLEELYRFLSTLPQEKHERYQREIQRYLKSEQAELFSPHFFDSLICDAIVN